MKKVVKVKELKSNVKVIREIKQRVAEGDKEIEEITENEVPIEAIWTSSFKGNSVFGVEREERLLAVGRPAAQSARREEETDMRGVSLYDVGKSMGGEAPREQYSLAENIGKGPTLRTLKVGRDFATSEGQLGYPETNRVESKLRQEDEKKYSMDTDLVVTGGKRKRYAWEV